MRNILGQKSPMPSANGDLAQSPDQLAISWDGDGRIAGAWPFSRNGSGSWEVQVERFKSAFNLAQAINLRRGGQAGTLALSSDTLFLTTIPEFSERTRILAL